MTTAAKTITEAQLVTALRTLYTAKNYLGKRAEEDAAAIYAVLPSRQPARKPSGSQVAAAMAEAYYRAHPKAAYRRTQSLKCLAGLEPALLPDHLRGEYVPPVEEREAAGWTPCTVTLQGGEMRDAGWVPGETVVKVVAWVQHREPRR
jgi:hypothetical protein